MRALAGNAVRVAAAVAAAAWMGVIFALSSLPGSAVPGRFGSLGHFVLYAVLGALLLLALPRTWPRRRAVVLAVAIASVYGVTDELHQHFVPGRVPDVLDWMVDTAGAMVAVGVIEALGLLRKGTPGARLVD